MQKRDKKAGIPITIKIGTADKFFERGRKIALALDRKEKIVPQRIITFEDVRDFTKFLTASRLALIRAIRKKPNSITGLARLLHKSRTAIGKDIDVLVDVGIVKTEYISNPGHGRCKYVMPIDDVPIRIEVYTVV